MPGMDGFEVARRMRKHFEGEPRIQIVALTGWGQESERQLRKAAGIRRSSGQTDQRGRLAGSAIGSASLCPLT
ncbi:hypothetical protein WKW82_36535 [Variovorax rhizosphaerae]|uniref:Response regulatory domain-containing protein n=2 Tax=Variovorax rhizosphaerae TaxID=1836200 RepID=A0ABU8WZ93_9BURK